MWNKVDQVMCDKVEKKLDMIDRNAEDEEQKRGGDKTEDKNGSEGGHDNEKVVAADFASTSLK